ncbi:glycerophosphoryl diester phosphodiesterase membrane domain-containing protein [Enterococcus sp. LJL128]|uniref:glycerophosphoryl diester phosphodiesterase membrane domain-containing protein n=1 Tax=Enterococcus sp. LJL51 TaxID=3416656 RepID=UPI003CE7DF36
MSKKMFLKIPEWWRKVIQILIFVTLMRIGHRVIIQPILDFIFQIGLQTTGFGVLFNNNMLSFFMTPIGFLSGLVMILLLAAISYFEFSIILTFIADRKENPKPSLINIISNFSVFKNSVKPISMISFFIYTFLFLPITGLGYSSLVFPYFRIPNFITGELGKSSMGAILIGLFFASLFCLFFLTIFTLPIMIIEGGSFLSAAKRSILLVKKEPLAVVKLIGFYLIVFGLFKLLPEYLVTVGYIPATLSELFNNSSLLPSLNSFLAWTGFLVYSASQLFVSPVLIILVSEWYLNLYNQKNQGAGESYSFKRIKNIFSKAAGNRRFRNVFILFTVCSTFLFLWRSSEEGEGLHQPIVIGHRGSSSGVENSLEAIQGAIDAGAEYAEIDILLSKDSVPMVIHDDSLQRLAGQNLYVYDLTAAELQDIKLQQNGFQATIPTLEEVLNYTKGKINLAVELKRHNKEKENLVDVVAKTMKKHGALESAIFLSLEYKLISEMNRKFPETISGYCIFGGLGYLSPDIIRTMNIDFVFIEEWMASRENLMEFRRAWLPVYIWTVNDPNNMTTYLEAGASGLVTDYPMQGKEKVADFNETDERVYLDEY